MPSDNINSILSGSSLTQTTREIERKLNERANALRESAQKNLAKEIFPLEEVIRDRLHTLVKGPEKLTEAVTPEYRTWRNLVSRWENATGEKKSELYKKMKEAEEDYLKATDKSGNSISEVASPNKAKVWDLEKKISDLKSKHFQLRASFERITDVNSPAAESARKQLDAVESQLKQLRAQKKQLASTTKTTTENFVPPSVKDGSKNYGTAGPKSSHKRRIYELIQQKNDPKTSPEKRRELLAKIDKLDKAFRIKHGEVHEAVDNKAWSQSPEVEARIKRLSGPENYQKRRLDRLIQQKNDPKTSPEKRRELADVIAKTKKKHGNVEEAFDHTVYKKTAKNPQPALRAMSKQRELIQRLEREYGEKGYHAAGDKHGTPEQKKAAQRIIDARAKYTEMKKF
jgi:hypothetical protein